MLVRPDHRPIDEVEGPIDLPNGVGLLLDGGKELVPLPSLGPASKAGVHALPGAISLGDIAPRGTGRQFPADAIEDPAIVLPRPAGLARGQERGEPLPFRIRKFVSSGHH